MIINDSKLEIQVDGKNVHTGDPVYYEEKGDQMIIKTTIGKTNKQQFKLTVTKYDKNIKVNG